MTQSKGNLHPDNKMDWPMRGEIGKKYCMLVGIPIIPARREEKQTVEQVD